MTIFTRQPIIISTNVSRQMGGEAIKALQLMEQLGNARPQPILITHERCRAELSDILPDATIVYVRDGWSMKWAWRITILRFLINPLFHLKVRHLIHRIKPKQGGVILHYLCPVSPISLRFPPPGTDYLMGPLTGNIYYPPGFRAQEEWRHTLGRLFHKAVQQSVGRLAGEKRRAKEILVSGGERTRVSVRWTGCPNGQIRDVIDAGIRDTFFNQPIPVQTGIGQHFVCSGRMVPHKALDLAIEAIGRTRDPGIRLDIFGDGPARARWQALTEQLGLTERVVFHGWLASHDELLARLRSYRGYLFPSLAEANGIVAQEAMSLGIPLVALNWGGPSLLADEHSAILINPENRAFVIAELAAAMDRLAYDADLANRLAQQARAVAEERFAWSKAVASWTRVYHVPDDQVLTGS